MVVEKVKESEKRIVLVAIRFDQHSRELLDWTLVKVAHPCDRVVALHVCRNSDSSSEDKTLLDSYLNDYDGLCNKKQVELTAQVSRGSSIRGVLVREAKNHAAVAVILGTSKRRALWSWTSIAKYCAKRLPPTTEVMAIHNGKVVFQRSSSNQLIGSCGDPKPSLHTVENSSFCDCQSEFCESETSEIGRLSHDVSQSFGDRWTNGTENPKEDSVSAVGKHKRGFCSSLGSSSIPNEGVSHDAPGWPLLRTACSSAQPAQEARKLSVVQWVMTLPNRSLPDSPISDSSPREAENVFGNENSYSIDTIETEGAAVCNQLFKDLKLLLDANSSGCKWFSYNTLKISTSHFSSENLIGKGGCNRVYKALLPDGKSLAVKISKSSEQALNDFMLEVDIMTSLQHKYIAPLLGICVEGSDLMSVYNFMSEGNLEENLHGRSNGNVKTVLPWGRRFRIAVGIAEALNYLHNGCPVPVIHRDVKSSNILLTNEFEPQLSDFGLAIWGPTKGSFITHSDLVGTFGYLAPEYFMYGKVSDKIDVYAYGVILLELLSGRKAIGSETPKGQESLVMWAKPKLESGEIQAILDENLEENIDDDQVQRLAMAARLCLTQAARLRPNMNKVMKLLMGEKDGNEAANAGTGDHNNSEEHNDDDDDDEVYPDSSAESHLSLALLDVNDNSTSFSSSSSLSVEGHLRKRWSRCSSLD